VTDFGDVLEGRVSLEDACQQHPRIKNLFFLPAPAFRGPEEIDQTAMRALMGQIREQFDYCVIDSPAGVGTGFRLAASDADTALIVATCDMSSMRDGQRVAAELRSLGIEEARLIVNRVNPKSFRRLGVTVDDVIDAVGARLIGIVEEDEAVFFASNKETPLILYEDKGAALEYLKIARRIAGERVPLTGKFSK
jgi:septum site-determining protein MinD